MTTHGVPAFVPGRAHTRYLVVRQEECWFITFNGEEFGPYRSEREAMLFAIDAAQKLGEQGEDTQVFWSTRAAKRSRSGPTAGPYPPRALVSRVSACVRSACISSSCVFAHAL